jgi:hypothetical protein
MDRDLAFFLLKFFAHVLGCDGTGVCNTDCRWEMLAGVAMCAMDGHLDGDSSIKTPR